MIDLRELFGTERAMLLIGAVLLFVASRVGAEVLAGKTASPGRRALGHWLPIAATALVALARRRGDIAVTIIFATSVGCLSLLLGAISIVTPESDSPGEYRRFWPFALPAALMALLTGFAGHLSWRNAVVLLIEGAVLFYVWQEISQSEPIAELKTAREPPRRKNGMWILNLVLCALIAILGAVAGLVGAEGISRNFSFLSDLTTIVGVLSPLLVLPMLTEGAALAQTDRAWAAVTSAVAVVLLNICVLLPVVALLWYLRQAVTGGLHGPIHFDLAAFWNASPLPFGWVTWRVDCVVLVLLSFVLFPASMGRWKLGRFEGCALIAIYVVYVVMEAVGSLRS